LNNISKQNENNVGTIENKINYLEQLYQINYNINLLKTHIDNIEQVILSSKLGILPRNILRKEEQRLISDLDTLKNIKIMVTTHNDQIVIILFIPQYSETIFSKILIEPIPNYQKKTVFLEKNIVLVDDNNNIYEEIVKDNLRKNLIQIKNVCISNILKFPTANCIMKINENVEIKEIKQGMIIIKNSLNMKLIQTCNKYNLTLTGNYLIKFENCKINKGELTFENYFTKLIDNVILPHHITKIIIRL